MSFDVLKKIKELKKSDMICAEGRYELVKAEVLKDMNSAGLILRHKKSGARVVVISNDDNNKVFSIGFKTPPYDDTGMQHIADAVKTKTVSLFGPTNPLTHGAYSDKAVFIEADCKCEYKYCYGTNMYWQCKDRKCLNDISAEHVINKMLQEKVWK